MQENKMFEFNFDELGVLYNALTVDIQRDEKRLSDYSIKRMEKIEATTEDEYVNDIHEDGLQQMIDYTKKLRSKVNEMIQNFDDGTNITTVND
jgi:hypothetical protein